MTELEEDRIKCGGCGADVPFLGCVRFDGDKSWYCRTCAGKRDPRTLVPPINVQTFPWPPR